MQIIKYPSKETWNEILKRPTQSLADIEQKVIPILEDVKLRGDEALKFYAQKFDNVELTELSVSAKEIEEALTLVSEELKQAIEVAYSISSNFISNNKPK